MFEFFAVAIAVVALIVARKAMDQAATLKSRLDALEGSGWRTAPMPPPLAPAQEAGPTAEATVAAPAIEPEAPFHEAAPTVAEGAAGAGPATPPPLPPATPGFEERVGTRWVVWLGGLTLALGGFFMVRYSIDAGLLGPGMRTLLGGTFALALLAAGEWTRRKESAASIAVLPIANIPAVLTAAGTAVAFGTAYAAYALYDFLGVAWRAPAATGAVAPAVVFVGLVFFVWAVRVNPDMTVWPGGPLPGIGPAPTDESVSLHLIVAALFAAAFGAAGFLVQGRPSNALVPVIWSASGVFAPLALLIAHLDRSVPFAIVAVGLASLFAAATEMLSRREARPGLVSSTALFATGTLAALALALTFALDRGWLTIALALTSAGAAWVSTQRPIPFLRALASILAGIVVLRVGYEPRIVGAAVGTTPIFNWLLWGYGIPALSFWAASIFLRRRGDDAPLRSVEAAAILFTVLLVFLEIRHAINAGDVYRNNADLTETALQVCAALAMSIGLERLRLRSGTIVHNVGAILLAVFAGLATLVGLLFIDNPVIWPTTINGEFINELLLGYAAPALLALLLSYAVAGRRHAAYGNTLAGGALVLALCYVSFEIRRLYHGPRLSSGATFDVEQYTYSIAWLAFGVLLPAIGIRANSQRARLASAAVIALTIGKVVLIDLSTLTGVYRALSFMGLGLVLVAIGWFYQKVLFRRPAVPATPVTGI